MNAHLPTITLIRYPWMAAAACAGINDATMHPDTDAQAEAAKTICRPCTVRAACLTYAYATDDRHGVLGGLTAEERRVLRRVVS